MKKRTRGKDVGPKLMAQVMRDYETRLRVGMVVALLDDDGNREPYVVTLVNYSRAKVTALTKREVRKTIIKRNGEETEIVCNESAGEKNISPNCECPILALSVEQFKGGAS